MDNKLKMLLAKILLNQGIFQKVMYDQMGLIGSTLENLLDEAEQRAPIIDSILDFIGVPADNTVEVGCDKPETICRDYWLGWDIMTIEDAQEWLNQAIEFAEQYKECDGDITKWSEKYEKTET